jgi:pimeloyl-ACP methyl ester carboxylesterase
MNDVENAMHIAEDVMRTPSTRQGTGPATVICLHSSGSTGGQWTALRSQLETKLQVLTPDLHGHGAGPAWHGFDEDIVAADAAHIARLVKSIPGDIHLVGHSYGGAIALRVALYHPESVTSVAVYEPVVFRLLFDYHGRRRPASEIIEVAMAMRRCVRSGDAARAASRFVDYWGGAGAWQKLSVGQRAAITNRTRIIAAHFTALANDAPRLADYRSFRAPVLMLAGSEMCAPIRRIRELLRFTLPNATIDTIPAMGHMAPITHASTVASRVALFVAKHASAVSPAARKLAA